VQFEQSLSNAAKVANTQNCRDARGSIDIQRYLACFAERTQKCHKTKGKKKKRKNMGRRKCNKEKYV